MSTVMEQHRVNSNIIAKRVILIDTTGTNRGEISIEELGKFCRAAGLDAVQVSPDQPVPIVRVCDYKKFLFDIKKKENHKKKSQAVTKQIVFSTGIAQADMDTKIRKVIEVLGTGDNAEVLVKSDNARDPDARIRNLQLAFEKAREIQAIIAQEKGVKTTPVVKQERAAKFFVNNSSKN